MSEEAPPPKRVRLSREDFDSMSKEDLFHKWNQQDSFVGSLETKREPKDSSDELVGLRESEEKLKQQQIEATRRENILVMRLTTKEQEMQELANQIQELKQAQNPSTAQLRSLLLDPAVNLLFQRMRHEMDAAKEKLEQTQSDLAAWKFTPDSQTGKRLMAKCRMLLTENEELGKVISSGRTAKLEGEIALEKTLVQEMKKSQEETDEFLVELDEDQEGMQTTIYLLQQQLRETKEQMSQLQQDNQQLQQAVAAATAKAAAATAAVQDSSASKSYYTNHNTVPEPSSMMEHQTGEESRTPPHHTSLAATPGGAAEMFSPSSPSPVHMDTNSGSNSSSNTSGLVERTADHNNHHHTSYHSNNYQQQQQPHIINPESSTNGDDHVSIETVRESQTPDRAVDSCEETTAEDESESSETHHHHGNNHHKVNHRQRHHTDSAASPPDVSTNRRGGGQIESASEDASSDAWSPPPQPSKHLDGVDDESSVDHLVSDHSNQAALEDKGSRVSREILPNGLIEDIPQSTSEEDT